MLPRSPPGVKRFCLPFRRSDAVVRPCSLPLPRGKGYARLRRHIVPQPLAPLLSFLKKCGLSFAEMHNKGVDAVVARMNLQYKVPLQCDDEFLSRLWLEKQGVRYIFHQDIFRANDEKLCLKATVELVCLINGRLGNSEDYDKAFERWL